MTGLSIRTEPEPGWRCARVHKGLQPREDQYLYRFFCGSWKNGHPADRQGNRSFSILVAWRKLAIIHLRAGRKIPGST